MSFQWYTKRKQKKNLSGIQLLVLHWCHNTLGSPIHRTGQRDVSHLMGALWPMPQCLGSQSHTQFLLELFRRDIREIIQTQLVGMAGRELHILSQDILIVLGEGLEAHLFLRCILVAFTKILAERHSATATSVLPSFQLRSPPATT